MSRDISDVAGENEMFGRILNRDALKQKGPKSIDDISIMKVLFECQRDCGPLV